MFSNYSEQRIFEKVKRLIYATGTRGWLELRDLRGSLRPNECFPVLFYIGFRQIDKDFLEMFLEHQARCSSKPL